jgi:NAD(P)H-hydrate epimerase
MMENAGRSMAVLVLRELRALPRAPRVLVIAGRGGNGGGGIAAARHLVGRAGRVELCLVEPGGLAAATAAQLVTYRAAGGDEVALRDLPAAPTYDVVVDAILGYGLSGAPREGAATAIRWVNACGARVLSLDLPSGVEADTGGAPGERVAADITLTLHLPKPGLVSESVGHLYLADLGIPAAADRRVGVAHACYGPAFVTPLHRRCVGETVRAAAAAR